MNWIRPCLTFSILFGLSSIFSTAQRPGQDPVERYLVPPDLIMQHQGALGLDEEQRHYFIGEVGATQPKITALHWDLQREMESLADLIRVETRRTSSTSWIGFWTLREIKRLHLTMAVRIRSQLSPEQLRILQRLRENMGPRPSH